ncbi:MAG: hypothetical protein ACI4IR_05565 [Eubacterium sp.]
MTTINIIALNREKAIRLSYSDFDKDKIIISIRDPNKVKPEFNINNSSIKDILYLSFYDISEETKSIFGGYESMSPIDAILIRDFVLKWQNEIGAIWVQCEMGMSRSAGIAAAIMEYFDIDSKKILESNQYYPNKLCYDLTKNVLNK